MKLLRSNYLAKSLAFFIFCFFPQFLYAASPVPGLSLIFPVPSGFDVTKKIFQDYAEFDDGSSMRHHAGIDIPPITGTSPAVKAAAGGTVHVITPSLANGQTTHCMGNVVVIEHSGNVATLYAHLSPTILVTEGQIVTQGAQIGSIGNTTGLDASGITCKTVNAHLHFELKNIPLPKPGAGSTLDGLRWLSDPRNNNTWGYTPGPVGTRGSMIASDHPDAWGYHDPILNIANGVVTLTPLTVEVKPLPAGTANINLRVGTDTTYRVVKGYPAGTQFTAINYSNTPTTGCSQGWYQLTQLSAANPSYFLDTITNSSAVGGISYVPDGWACKGDGANTFIGPLTVLTPKFAYVANYGSNNISAYTINPTTGTLTAGTPVAAGIQPISVTVDPFGKFAYVANYGSSNVSVYTINPTTGALTAGVPVAAGTWPASIAVDPTGRFAYVANWFSGNISVYTINQTTGALSAVTSVAAGTGPNQITVDPTGKFAYVANQNSNNVSVYTINPITGVLTAGTPVAAGMGPQSITVDPTGRFVYVANSNSNNVSVYSISPTTGALTAGTSVATGFYPMSVTVDPTGKFAYVANMNSNNVSAYTINQVTGALTAGVPVATGFSPISVTVDPTGKFAYVANYSGGTVSTYTVNPTTGVLTPGNPATAGSMPYSITTTASQVASPPAKLNQTIGTINFSPATLTVGGTTTASATATSGLPVSLSSATLTICTVNPATGVVTGVSAGICTITANQAGNAVYNPAPQVTRSITVGKGSQSIGAIGLSKTALAVGGTATAIANTTSGLTVNFTSTTPGICTVSTNNTVAGIAAGTCTIAANQAGNAAYNPAPQVTKSTTVMAGTYAPKFAYVANSGSGNISVYTINPSIGALTAGTPVLAGIAPTSVTVDPTGNFAYVANWGSANVSVYTVNPATGALTAGAPVAAGTWPTSVTVDPTGRFAYVANYGSNNVSVYSINSATGILTTGTPVATGVGPNQVTVDPTGKFAYVANQGSNNISVYTINPATGALTAGSPVAAGAWPSSVAVDPTGKFAYVANNTSSTVSVYTINPATGALTPVGLLSVVAGTGPYSVTVDSTGKFAYVANSGGGNVSAYTINPITGALTPVGLPVAAGTQAWSVTVDPTGKFAYVANYGSNNVSVYTVNPITGALTAGIPVVAGVRPYSVTTVAGIISSAPAKSNQTIGTINFSPTTLTVGGTTTASATATSGLPVSLSSATLTICTVNPATGVVTGVAAGICTITANQAGNASYNPAPQMTQNFAVGQASGTYVLQPGPGQGKDIWTTSLYSYAPIGPGPGGGLNDDTLRVGGWGDLYYSLLEFNLAGMPQQASSAVLYLYNYSSNGGTPTGMYLDRITQAWSWVDRLWWASRPTTVQWSPGILPAPAIGAWYAINVTNLYNAWKAGTYPNYGIQLRPVSNANNYNFFYSSDYLVNPALRPKLVVSGAIAAPAPGVSFSASKLTFASRNVGTTSTAKTVTLTNTGTAVLNITSILASGDFARTTTCTANLAAGASCVINVTFTPSLIGTRTGTITLTTNAPGLPRTISLAGAGGTRSDFNGDGKADILWRNTATGANTLWQMNGGTATPVATTALAIAWSAVAQSDFNGDGKADILWHNVNGANTIWLMNGATPTPVATTAITGWAVQGVADFDGDGRADDILWYNPLTRSATVWLMNSNVLAGQGVVGAIPAGFISIAGLGDFTGDGKADILLRNPTTGANTLWPMNGVAHLAAIPIATVAIAYNVEAVGDFNGDGKADILWRNRATGSNTLWLMNGTLLAGSVVLAGPPAGWTVAKAVDFNGDGKTDLLWSNGVGNQIWLMNGVLAPTAFNNTNPAGFVAVRE